MKFALARLGATIALCLFGASALAAGLFPISQIFVFGDSLSDTGNALAMTGGTYPPSPTYFDGRLSNGLLWVEPLASDWGVTVTNYAVAGAQTGTGNWIADEYPALAGTGLQAQVGQFSTNLGARMADPGAIYAVFAGSNNFCQTCFIPGLDDPVEFVNEGVTEILTAVGTLQALGAQKFVVFGLPDLGLTPRAAGIPIPGIQEQLSMLTDGWNQALFGNLPGLGLPQLVTIDLAQILRDVVGDPEGFGFFNVTDACLAVGCNAQTKDPLLDPDGFLFWDGIHPTRATHAVLADIIRRPAVIPLPAAVWLFGSALGLLGLRKFRAA